jgi:shikimate kinase
MHHSHTPLDGLTRKTASSTPDIEISTQNSSQLHTPRSKKFESSASIALVGVNSVGKKSLAYFAATAYQRKLVDTERAFRETTGSTGSAYRKAEGPQAYQQRRNEVFRSVLQKYSQGAVIVCSFSDVDGEGTNLLREFSQSHAVIHITRDAAGMSRDLKVWSVEKISKLLDASRRHLQPCTNYEFLNLTEPVALVNEKPQNGTNSPRPTDSPSGGRFLALKGVERDFLRFLGNILGSQEHDPDQHSASPFSQVRIADRKHTFCTEVDEQDVLGGNVDIAQMQLGADCIALIVECPVKATHSTPGELALSFATLRRRSILPLMIRIVPPPTSVHQRKLFELTDFALRLCPELCTFDLSMSDSAIKQLIRAKGSTIVIGITEIRHRPAEGWKDDACLRDYRRAAQSGCDLFKITMPADTTEDIYAINGFRAAVESLDMTTRLIAYSTGRKGKLSCLNNNILTAVRPPTEALGSTDASIQSSLFTAKDLTRTLFATAISDPLHFFVFGADVSYSVSPAMYQAAYKVCGLQYTYKGHSTDKVDDIKAIMAQDDFGGNAFAMPYKTTMLSSLDGLSPHARVIGAVNTVIPVRDLRSDGSIPDDLALITRNRSQGPVKGLYGFNTGRFGGHVQIYLF